jgi:filamentous hemagglutinin family protein
MIANRTFRRSLRALTSFSALAAGLASAPAGAQSAPTAYNAPDPTVASGSVGISRGIVSGQETYTVNSPTAVLDFTPSDQGVGGGPIAFQDAGTSVTYVNGANNGGFTILNRIVPVDPTRPVGVSGTVRAQVNGVAGGNVWFYSPGGIILGSSAAFDVGGLLLTARDPTGGSGVIGSTTSFAGGGAPGARIQISAGATISATPEGSYVALMAPAIIQNGAVRVNGSAAYVAAEQATLTINSGLFDIVVDTGTDTDTGAGGGFVLDHGGSTSGPSSLTGNHNLYMVAVPKNDAISLLVHPDGDMGFGVAGAASVVNGTVVLSAGRGVTGGRIDSAPAQGNADASVIIVGGGWTSHVIARARTDAIAASTLGTPTFYGDLTLQGGGQVLLAGRQAGATLTVGGDATLIGDQSFTETPTPATTGATTSVFTDNGGSVTVGGNLLMTADVTVPAGAAGASGTGGRALVRAIGGAISIGGGVTLSADAIGGASGPLGTGAVLTGGFAEMVAESGGTIDVTGRLVSHADAIGALSMIDVAGASTGGQAYVRTEATGGAIRLRGDVDLHAVGTGASAGAAGATGGDGVGGAVYVRGQSGTIRIDGAASLDGSGAGGDADTGADGGAATGGNVFIQADAGSALTLGSDVALLSDARGGVNNGGGDGIGGAATGGPAAIIAIGDIALAGDATLSARASGGAKRSGNGGAGGAAQGGRARILGAGGAFTIGGAIRIDATAVGGFVTGGATGNGGSGRGGGARLGTIAAGSTLAANGNVDLRADGSGGGGAGAGSFGGDGFGGNLVSGADYLEGVYLVNDAGTLGVTGDVQMSATGFAGSGAIGGTGVGGIGYATGFDGPLTVGGGLVANVDGDGGDALADGVVGSGAGGAGNGGSFQIGTFAQNGIGGSVSLQTVSVSATGLGGDGADGLDGVGGRGGDGIGGRIFATADASAGAVSTGTMILAAEGDGGDGGAGAVGKAGTAGFAGGAGGNGTGGNVQIGTVSGANLAPNTGSATFGAVTLFADGVGGDGGAGGAGGSAILDPAPNQPAGDGGDGGLGGAGGSGAGGFVATLSRGTPLTAASVQALVLGIGGDGGAGGEAGLGGLTASSGATGVGGNGGAAFGGGASFAVTNRAGRPERGSATIGSLQYSTFALGGFGTASGAATTGEGLITILNGDASLTDLSFANNLGDLPGGSPAIAIEIAGGALEVANSLDIGTGGDLALNVRDGGLLRAQSINLVGAGSLLSAVPGGTVGAPGRIEVGSDLSASFDSGFGTGTTLAIGANLDVRGNVFLSGDQVTLANMTATGFAQINGQAVRAGDIRADGGVAITTQPPEFLPPTGGDVATGSIASSGGAVSVLVRNGALSAAGVSAADAVTLVASGAIATGDVTSARDAVAIQSLGGSVRAGAVSAAKSLSVDASGAIATGALVAASAGYVDPASSLLRLSSTTGAIRTGNAAAVDIVVRQGDNGSAADIVMGDLAAERMTIVGRGDIALGNVAATDLYPAFAPDNGLQTVINGGGGLRLGAVTGQDNLILHAGSGPISAGQIRTPASLVILGSRDVTLAGVATGTRPADILYVSATDFLSYDDSYRLNGAPFDTGQLFGASLGAVDGATLTSGPITTGTFRAGAQYMQLDAIGASQRIDLFGTRNVAFSSLVSSPDISVDSGDIGIGATAARAAII